MRFATPSWRRPRLASRRPTGRAVAVAVAVAALAAGWDEAKAQPPPPAARTPLATVAARIDPLIGRLRETRDTLALEHAYTPARAALRAALSDVYRAASDGATVKALDKLVFATASKRYVLWGRVEAFWTGHEAALSESKAVATRQGFVTRDAWARLARGLDALVSAEAELVQGLVAYEAELGQYVTARVAALQAKAAEARTRRQLAGLAGAEEPLELTRASERAQATAEQASRMKASLASRAQELAAAAAMVHVQPPVAETEKRTWRVATVALPSRPAPTRRAAGATAGAALAHLAAVADTIRADRAIPEAARSVAEAHQGFAAIREELATIQSASQLPAAVAAQRAWDAAHARIQDLRAAIGATSLETPDGVASAQRLAEEVLQARRELPALESAATLARQPSELVAWRATKAAERKAARRALAAARAELDALSVRLDQATEAAAVATARRAGADARGALAALDRLMAPTPPDGLAEIARVEVVSGGVKRLTAVALDRGALRRARAAIAEAHEAASRAAALRVTGAALRRAAAETHDRARSKLVDGGRGARWSARLAESMADSAAALFEDTPADVLAPAAAALRMATRDGLDASELVVGLRVAAGRREVGRSWPGVAEADGVAAKPAALAALERLLTQAEGKRAPAAWSAFVKTQMDALLAGVTGAQGQRGPLAHALEAELRLRASAALEAAAEALARGARRAQSKAIGAAGRLLTGVDPVTALRVRGDGRVRETDAVRVRVVRGASGPNGHGVFIDGQRLGVAKALASFPVVEFVLDPLRIERPEGAALTLQIGTKDLGARPTAEPPARPDR